MFDNLTDRLSRTLRNISGRGRLTEENIKETLREVRMALLEADVALPVVRDFINRVKEKAVGHEVNKSLTPGQEFVKIVRNELVSAMGEENQVLNLAAQPPAVVLMAGLQGAGKTTSVGKLGKFLREKHKKKVLVVSADVYRPAAIKQLETLAEQVGVDFFPSDVAQKPVDIVNAALKEAKLKFYDVLLVDTAGRLHVDEAMMDEIKQVHASINPVETLFVVDAMIHNWGDSTTVRPRSAGIVEAGGEFQNNYILLKPVGDLQMYPTMTLAGSGAVARFNSVVVAPTGSHVDCGNRIDLAAPDTRGEIISRVVTTGGTVINRGFIGASAAPAKGHLECKGLILGGGRMLQFFRRNSTGTGQFLAAGQILLQTGQIGFL